MSVKLLTEHNLEFLSLTGDYRGSSESTLVKCHIVGNHMSRLKSYEFLSMFRYLQQLLIRSNKEP